MILHQTRATATIIANSISIITDLAANDDPIPTDGVAKTIYNCVSWGTRYAFSCSASCTICESTRGRSAEVVSEVVTRITGIADSLGGVGASWAKADNATIDLAAVVAWMMNIPGCTLSANSCCCGAEVAVRPAIEARSPWKVLSWDATWTGWGGCASYTGTHTGRGQGIDSIIIEPWFRRASVGNQLSVVGSATIRALAPWRTCQALIETVEARRPWKVLSRYATQASWSRCASHARAHTGRSYRIASIIVISRYWQASFGRNIHLSIVWRGTAVDA